MTNIKEVEVKTLNIRLDQFLKWAGIVDTGGIAKAYIIEGKIRVNGIVVKERGKKLSKGDIVKMENNSYKVI